MPPADTPPLRHLVLVLGDQLDLQAAAFDGFDNTHDAVWMAEVAEESTHVWSSKPRTVLFLAAMRHFAQALRQQGRTVHYTRLDDAANRGSLAAELAAAVERLRPQALAMTAPGDWRVLQALRAVAQRPRQPRVSEEPDEAEESEAAQAAQGEQGLPLTLHDDRHFYGTVREFAAHARGRKQLRMEYFYREMRRRHAVLMEGDQPAGGQWNFDAENREAFGPLGPADVPAPTRFEPDATTREVMALVEQRFADHPGRLETFAWPVTRAQALHALERFIQERLPAFYWTGRTPMACLADAIGQTLEHGYAHHIQRLMVTGLYALLLGVDPKAVHAWYLAVYVDAVEWVELPNTLGMSQAADGGLMASKPYIAGGKYIERMSARSLCATCRFKPGERTGDRACPFTTLYWDFLMRHEDRLAANPRTVMQVKNLARLDAEERRRIAERAADIRRGKLAQARSTTQQPEEPQIPAATERQTACAGASR